MIVVTRHPALTALLVERGLAPEGTVARSEVSADDVLGQRVIGVLPIQLAALCDSVTVVPLDVPAALRGKELDLEQTRELAGEARTFVVRETTSDELCELLEQIKESLDLDNSGAASVYLRKLQAILFPKSFER